MSELGQFETNVAGISVVSLSCDGIMTPEGEAPPVTLLLQPSSCRGCTSLRAAIQDHLEMRDGFSADSRAA